MTDDQFTTIMARIDDIRDFQTSLAYALGLELNEYDLPMRPQPVPPPPAPPSAGVSDRRNDRGQLMCAGLTKSGDVCMAWVNKADEALGFTLCRNHRRK